MPAKKTVLTDEQRAKNIRARADQGSLEAEGHVVTAEFRDTIATFFSVARHGL
jgi:hypothetical protein